MTRITALVKRHPLPAYYTLTFNISWGGMLMVIGVGVLSTGLASGWTGFDHLARS